MDKSILDNAVLNVRKGQNITIIIEGYEDHIASFEYDDVLQVILTQAQSDLNKRRSERQRLQYERDAINHKYNSENTASGCPVPSHYSGLGLYPRNY